MKRFAFILSSIVLVAALGFLAWRMLPPGTTFFTDAGRINEPAATAQVRDILWEPPLALTDSINADGETYEPRLSNDGSMLYFVRGKAGNNADIFFAQRTQQGWTTPQSVAEINSDADELGPEPSTDGESLYFYSNRAGGLGGYDLWASHRDADGAWREPANLGPGVNSQFNDYGPALTADGRTLYFSSNRPLPGDDRQPNPNAWSATLREEFFTRTYDLYCVTLTESGAGTAQPLSSLNTPHNEGAPALSAFGDFLYFASDRPGGSGGFDLYRSRRLRGAYQPATNLGASLNTTYNELDPALSMNGFGLDFSSNRPASSQEGGSAREYKLYHTNSREVFSEAQRSEREPIDWAAIWHAVGPNLLWALLALALLLVMLLMFKGGQNRKLSLLAKCVLASLAAHLLLMLLFNVWEVAATVAGEIRGPGKGGGIRVALSPSGGGGIVAQLGGSFSQVTTPPARFESTRAPMISESNSTPPRVDISLAATTLDLPSAASPEMQVEEAVIALRSSTIPDTALHVDPSQPQSMALNVPSAPSSMPTTEAITQIGPAQMNISRQHVSLVSSAEPTNTLSLAAPARSQLPSTGRLIGSELSAETREAPVGNIVTGSESLHAILPLPASGVGYRVQLAADFPEAPASMGMNEKPATLGPAVGVGSSGRRDTVIGISETAPAIPSNASPGFGHANLKGMGRTGDTSQTLSAVRDSQGPTDLTGNASGQRALGTALADQIGAAGASQKNSASLPLALPKSEGPQSGSAVAGTSEERGTFAYPSGTLSATRAPLANEFTRSSMKSGPAGAGDLPLPRVDLIPAGGRSASGAATGTKDGSALASLARDAVAGTPSIEQRKYPALSPKTDAPSLALNLPSDVAPVEDTAPGKGAGQPEIIGTIRGTVINRTTRAPLPLAQVRLVLPDGEITATTDSAGKYTLDVPVTPDFFALSASLDPFVPLTANIERARLEKKGKLVVNFALEPENQNARVTEGEPDVHHLGDDRFSGSINSQFQKRSEGAKFSTQFEIPAAALSAPLDRAEIRLMTKGVQRRHKLFINGKILSRRLDDAPEDGGFGEFIAPFDSALLVAGANTLRIEALPSDDDIDDFEFVNIRVYLVPPTGHAGGTDPSAKPALGMSNSQ